MCNFTKEASPETGCLCCPSALANLSIPEAEVVQGVRCASVTTPKSEGCDPGKER